MEIFDGDLKYKEMCRCSPFKFDSVYFELKKIYFYDGEILCSCNLKSFPPKRRGIFLAVDKNKAFIVKASQIHDGKYSYSKSKYLTYSEMVIVTCNKHGDFKTTPHEHINNLHGCKWCQVESTRVPKDVILTRCIERHGNLYEYDFSDYSGSIKKGKIGIYCEAHGWFKQSPYNHYANGQGCRECGKLVQGGKSLSDHVTTSIRYGGESHLYLIRCKNESEVFYKIGISVTGVSGRYNSGNILYKYEILSERRLSAEKTWKTEKALLKRFVGNSYKPKIKFSGYTECFKFTEIELSNVLKMFEDI